MKIHAALFKHHRLSNHMVANSIGAGILPADAPRAGWKRAPQKLDQSDRKSASQILNRVKRKPVSKSIISPQFLPKRTLSLTKHGTNKKSFFCTQSTNHAKLNNKESNPYALLPKFHQIPNRWLSDCRHL